MKGALHQALQPDSVRILAGAFGAGRSIWVPDSTASPAAKRLECLIGLSETAALVNAFGGGPVYLPGLPPQDGKPRGPSLREVKRLSRSLSANEIAGRFGCSVRTIYNRRAALKRMEGEKHG